jgi:hypothetical protein
LRIPELNSSKGSTPFSPGVSISMGTPWTRAALMSTLSLSLTSRKFTASVPFPTVGTIGGRMCRSKAHWVDRKNGWAFTSDAPALDPRRRFSSLTRSFFIRDLQLLQLIISHVSTAVNVMVPRERFTLKSVAYRSLRES